ncbi:hypothetical protein L195_g005377 [Trifolium pratense]|uniref:Uncharacterized protein n=1 Tax=Trifolium pratense TaxID=57577 RepID=A0A2K3P0M7_TRIPR|nr:hypothetical protein L195_g005377 [Trifolium pratense]
MGDQSITKTKCGGLTTMIKALSNQIATLTTKVDDIDNNNNRNNNRNKNYSLTDLLRHASRMAVDEIFSFINNDTTEIIEAFVVGKNRVIEDLSSSKVVETDEF